MKKINRAKLRGKPLDNDCRLAMKKYRKLKRKYRWS